jgi:predicted PurR-regulated permease PerM
MPRNQGRGRQEGNGCEMREEKPERSPQKHRGDAHRIPPIVLPLMAYFFFAAFFAAFFAGFFAAFFVAMVSILPFRCLHRSLQHKCCS